MKEAEKKEVIHWLSKIENRNVSELERHLIENYDVVFKSRQSYYQLLKEAKLTWQKLNKENKKKPSIDKKEMRRNLRYA